MKQAVIKLFFPPSVSLCPVEVFGAFWEKGKMRESQETCCHAE